MKKTDFKYCTRCGHPLESRTIQAIRRKVCPYCDTVYYDNPIPSVAVIARNVQGQLLLVKRKAEPKKGFWALPGGFMDGGESVTQAALREMKEETGLEGKIKRLIRIVNHESKMYGHVMIIIFEVEMTGGQLRAGDDAECTAFFSIEELPPLAFHFQEEAVAEVTGHILSKKINRRTRSPEKEEVYPGEKGSKVF